MSTIVPRKRLSTGLVVTLKVFVRSRNGGATKIVHEQYLRDDIPCYSKACSYCGTILQPDANGEVPTFVLSETPLYIKDYGHHYIVVDTNIVLKAIDLLENTSAFFDVIVPQTVLEEVKNRSIPIYVRLRGLCKAEEKRFAVFHNEFQESTFVNRGVNETINDRNDRAIRKTSAYFQQHLAENIRKDLEPINIVFVCDDRDNRKKANHEGITAVSLEDYVGKLPNGKDLLDLIPESSPSFSKKEETKFPDFYSAARLMGGVKNGTLYQGVINISSYNYIEGTVTSSGFNKPLLLLGRTNLNRSFNGDQVVVELLPRSHWKSQSSEIVEEDTLDSNDNPDDSGFSISDKERLLLLKEAQESTDSKVQPTARVVGITKRSWRLYVGQIAENSVGKDIHSSNAPRNCFVKLMDRTLPKIRIRTRKAKELLGKRIVVAVDSWRSTSKYPEGHFVRSLGDVESVQAETEALLLEHDVEYRPFGKKVLQCLPKEGHDWKVPETLDGDEFIKKRKDFRDKLVCSIDPPGCVDIDDALHAKLLPDGNWEVGVHIADVTHFVKPNTPLDAEGASRGTSVYLVDKRIDMLPELLGTDLCSLKPYVDRFSFSVIWKLDSNANILDVKFHKSIIKSREAFSYEQAQLRIDDKSNQDDLTNGMRALLDLSIKLKQKRLADGALNLASPEVKVYMDSETADPGEVEIKKLLGTNSLVEEFMLLANISVAKKIYGAFPQTAMLRRHAPPPATNFEVLNDMLKVRKNMHISLESSKALADSLDRCEDKSDKYFNTLLRIMATRCMMAAEYFASGCYGYSEFRHYGLASEIYTHFTSPIRRYCDVVAHRQLAAAIEYESLDFSHRDKDKMELICKNINKRHRNAQFAGRASIEYYVGQVMKNKTKDVHQGYVIKVFSNGIVVIVPKFGIEGLIKLDSLGDASTAEFDPEQFSLSFVNHSGAKKNLAVFEKVTVKVDSVLDPVTSKRKAQLVLVE